MALTPSVLWSIMCPPVLVLAVLRAIPLWAANELQLDQSAYANLIPVDPIASAVPLKDIQLVVARVAILEHRPHAVPNVWLAQSALNIWLASIKNALTLALARVASMPSVR